MAWWGKVWTLKMRHSEVIGKGDFDAGVRGTVQIWSLKLGILGEGGSAENLSVPATR